MVGRGSLLAMKLAPRHYFYDRCNEILAGGEFDEAVEMLCQSYYEDDGRLSVPPGRYFRMLFVGQFEGLDSEREIEWRCADSLSLQLSMTMSKARAAASGLERVMRSSKACTRGSSATSRAIHAVAAAMSNRRHGRSRRKVRATERLRAKRIVAWLWCINRRNLEKICNEFK